MLIFLSMLESDEERRLFTDLYNQYGNMMLHVAKRYFPKDMYAAEDVVQNAWIRVVDHFQKIQAVPSKKRGAYLVVIVNLMYLLQRLQNERNWLCTCAEPKGGLPLA